MSDRVRLPNQGKCGFARAIETTSKFLARVAGFWVVVKALVRYRTLATELDALLSGTKAWDQLEYDVREIVVAVGMLVLAVLFIALSKQLQSRWSCWRSTAPHATEDRTSVGTIYSFVGT